MAKVVLPLAELAPDEAKPPAAVTLDVSVAVW